MKKEKKKRIILSLIKDDLVNTKLLNGLSDIGLSPENYDLQICDTIFNLMGINSLKSEEVLYDFYFRYTEKACHLDVHGSSQVFDQLANEIYVSLKTLKKSQLRSN